MERTTIELAFEKETKGTFRYQEIETDQPPAIGSLYVKKYVLGSDPPKKLRITIEAAK